METYTDCAETSQSERDSLFDDLKRVLIDLILMPELSGESRKKINSAIRLIHDALFEGDVI